MRLDRALITDLRVVARSRPLLLFGAIEVAAGMVFVLRRGSETISTVLLIWLGMLVLAFFAWWAGRHRLAHPDPDAVPGAPARAVFALLGVIGMLFWSFDLLGPLGFVLLMCGMGGWVWSALRTDGLGNAVQGLVMRLTRDPRPFIPLLLLIAVPRLVAGGPAFIFGAVVALPSGITQQLLYLIGLFAPLEAIRGRTAAVAVVSALLFGLIHVPIVVDANQGDLMAAVANAVLFQASVGLIACLAFVRHRAAVPIGVAHALAIG